MPQLYYQLGGHQAQIKWYPLHEDKSFATALARSSSKLRITNEAGSLGGFDLILGIKRSGASHLLIPTEVVHDISGSLQLPRVPSSVRPMHAGQFESLSPIRFNTVEDLVKKLSTLRPKRAKDGDTSQANRGFDDYIDDLYRGAFEHGRLLYRILANTANPAVFSVEDISFVPNLRVGAFLFNTWDPYNRTTEEKRKHPQVLDFGFCSARLPDLQADLATGLHVVDSGNSHLRGRRANKATFLHGNTESMRRDAMQARLQELFGAHTCRTSYPMILLVYDEDVTLNYLRDSGVDVSFWRSGISDILEYQLPEDNYYRSRDRDPRHQSLLPYDDDIHYHSNRSRSRSPRRLSGHQRSSSSLSKQDTKPQQYTNTPQQSNSHKSYAPVYIIDVYRLYTRLMQSEPFNGIVSIAQGFKITQEEGFCAGNEAIFLIDIWRSMISGPPIDEQRALREAGLKPSVEVPIASGPTLGSAPAEAGSDDDDDDDERDPNDIYVQPSAAAPAKVDTPYGDLDHSDYGSSSDEDD